MRYIKNNEIKAAIITGAGQKVFVAGADISEFSVIIKKTKVLSYAKRGREVLDKIEAMP